MNAPALRARHIIEALTNHRVEYVLIGGYAAAVYGASRPTYDIDITPATTHANLSRLATALRELHAGIRVDELPEGLPFDTSPEALLGMRMLNLRTPYGDLDLTFEPAGTTGYADLAAHAEALPIDGITVHVAALTDIIRSKEAAGRDKDTAALPELYKLARDQEP